MSKVKYYYDSENLSYKRVKTKRSKRVVYALLFVVSSAMFGFLFLFLFSNTDYFRTPRDKMLTRKLNYLELHYNILNEKVNDLDQVLLDIEKRDNAIYRTYFNIAEIPHSERRIGFGGVNKYQSLDDQLLQGSTFISNLTQKTDELSKAIAIQSHSLDEIVALAKDKKRLLAAIPAIQPIKNEDLRRIASGFGYRSDPFTKIRKFHYGMDFSAKRGTPIYATGNGVIKRADSRLSGYGKHIEIDHGFGYLTLYAHLDKYNCKRGQRVKRGDIIGYVGSTGRSEAPHLHYEVIRNGKKINPINYYYGSISAEDYIEISKAANLENQSLD